MKTKLITIALIAITCITSQLFAQESGAKTTGYDLKKNVKCLVSTTETGYSIAFEYDIVAPRDVASGQATGKRGYDYYQAKSEYSVSATDNSVTEIISPRDAASGLPTGKRQHKPIKVTSEIDKSTPLLAKAVSTSETTSEASNPRDAASGLPTGKRQHKPVKVTKEMDKSSPKLAQTVSTSETDTEAKSAERSGMGAGKVNFQDLHVSKATFKEFTITKRCGNESTEYSVIDGECVIPTNDCPNGVCTLTADWSWGTSNSDIKGSVGEGMSRSSVDFFLKIEDGACTAMAINEKGLPGDKKPKKTTTNNPK